jgi:hypothetical protein
MIGSMTAKFLKKRPNQPPQTDNMQQHYTHSMEPNTAIMPKDRILAYHSILLPSFLGYCITEKISGECSTPLVLQLTVTEGKQHCL